MIVIAALALFFSMTILCNILGEWLDQGMWFFLAIPCTILLMAEGANVHFTQFGYVLIAYDTFRVGRYIYNLLGDK